MKTLLIGMLALVSISGFAQVDKCTYSGLESDRIPTLSLALESIGYVRAVEGEKPEIIISGGTDASNYQVNVITGIKSFTAYENIFISDNLKGKTIVDVMSSARAKEIKELKGSNGSSDREAVKRAKSKAKIKVDVKATKRLLPMLTDKCK